MGSRFSVHDKSAIGYNAIRATLSQEVFRRMSHCSVYKPVSERVDILKEFSAIMTRSSYNMEKRQEIIMSGLLS